MHRNNKNDLKDRLMKERKEKLRRKSVEAIIQENINISNEQGFILRVVTSPADYPYYEQLDFNLYEFNNFFNQLLKKKYNLSKGNQSILFFDPQGSIIDYSAFLHPVIPDKWMSLRKINRFNNILIKQDGVILFITSQNDVIENRVILDLDQLSIHLEIFFSQIIPEIYKKMNYDDRLNINIECLGLSDCILLNRDHPKKQKLLRDTSSTYSNSYILNLQNPITISDKIILALKRLFEF